METTAKEEDKMRNFYMKLVSLLLQADFESENSFCEHIDTQTA